METTNRKWLGKLRSAALMACFACVVALAGLGGAANGEDLPPCDNTRAKAENDDTKCGTYVPCPTTSKALLCTGSTTVVSQTGYTPCTGGGTDSQRCKAVPDFVCTKSYKCTLERAQCVMGQSVKNADGTPVVSTTNNGTVVSCKQKG